MSNLSHTLAIMAVGLLVCLGVYTEGYCSAMDYNAFFNSEGLLPSRTLIDKAWEAVHSERYDSAAAYYTIVASRYSEDAPRDEVVKAATASVNVGYIWLVWRMNGAEAYPWLMKAHEIAVRHDLPEVEIGVNSNLGWLYFNYGNIPKAMGYFREAMRGVTHNHADLYFTTSLIELATAGVMCADYAELGKCVGDVARYPLDSMAPQRDYANRLIASLLELTDGRPQSGARMLESWGDFPEMYSDGKRYLVMHHFVLGKMWTDAGFYDKGASHMQTGVGIAERERYYNLAEKGYQELAECHTLAGRQDSAAMCRYKMLHIRDSLFSVADFESVKDRAIAGELSALTRNVTDAEKRVSRLRGMLLWICLAAVVIVAVSIWLYVGHKRLKGAYRELYCRNMELLQASAPPVTGDAALSRVHGSTDEDAGDFSGEQEESDTAGLFLRIEEVMKRSSEIYDPDFSLERLADMVGRRGRLVSRSINLMTGKNFSTYIGEYRIREACRRLADLDNLRSMKIESVAEGVGYRSRTYFSRLFKDVTGLTPSQFIAQRKADATSNG